MTRKVYKTAQGKTVDLGALMLQNENTRAVGNMQVNARGDLVDGWNRPIDRRTQQVQKQYDRQITNVRDDPVVSSNSLQPDTTQPKHSKSVKSKDIKIEPSTPVEEPAAPSGLAAAIARARQIRQEPIETPKQIAKNQSRITRI